MEIQIIGSNPSIISYWLNAFQFADPDSDFTVTNYIDHKLIDCIKTTVNVIFLTDTFTEEEYTQLLISAINNDIKVIFNAHLTKSEILNWLEKGVSGIINEHISIEKISSMLAVINNDGIYYLPKDTIA